MILRNCVGGKLLVTDIKSAKGFRGQPVVADEELFKNHFILKLIIIFLVNFLANHKKISHFKKVENYWVKIYKFDW